MSIWVKKYMPKTLDDYVFQDENQKARIIEWVTSGEIPHIMLSGSPGVGKSALISLLLTLIKVDPYDVLEVNASKNNGVDFIRETITKFVQTMGVGDMRYVVLQEADYLSPNAQAVLRDDIERYADNVRFIITCNYAHKIMPALHSRFEVGKMHIDRLDKDMFTYRIAVILQQEGISFDLDTLDIVVANTYPDLRRGINQAQRCSVGGALTIPVESGNKIQDYMVDAITLFRTKQYREARSLLVQNAKNEEIEDIYRFCYENIGIWADGDVNKEDKCILAIRDGIVKDTQVSDREINLSALLVELEMIATGRM